MENEKIPNINKFKILTFAGSCSGNNLTLLDDIQPILGKQLRIFKITLKFYNAIDIGFPYFVSKNNTLTADLYGKIKAFTQINYFPIRSTNGDYLNFKINNNLVFPTTIKPNGELDLETNFITERINSIELKISLTIYDGISDSFLYPDANFKIFCEVL